MVCSIAASPSNTSQPLGVASCLSTPDAMVALPCGSRSTSSTLRLAAASAAARLTAVVVLPTPPFWLATAMIRAMSRPVPCVFERTARLAACPAEHDEMTLRRPQTRHVEGMDCADCEGRRHARKLVIRRLALHRQPDALRRQQVTAPTQHVGETGEGTRGDAVELAFHLFHARLH